MNVMNGWSGILCCCLVMTGTGCGSKDKLGVTPVSGTIKYKGAPVDGAVVTFATEASPRTAVGVTNSQGEFKLTTINTDDGAVPGEHSITIVKVPPPGSKPAGNPMSSPEDLIKAMEAQGPKNTQPPGAAVDDKSFPAKYANPATSGLKRTVVAGEPNVFSIDLTE